MRLESRKGRNPLLILLQQRAKALVDSQAPPWTWSKQDTQNTLKYIFCLLQLIPHQGQWRCWIVESITPRTCHQSLFTPGQLLDYLPLKPLVCTQCVSALPHLHGDRPLLPRGTITCQSNQHLKHLLGHMKITGAYSTKASRPMTKPKEWRWKNEGPARKHSHGAMFGDVPIISISHFWPC